MEYARTLEFSSDERTLVLEVAFEHGLVEIDVREVLAIELRDGLLKLAELDDRLAVADAVAERLSAILGAMWRTTGLGNS